MEDMLGIQTVILDQVSVGMSRQVDVVVIDNMLVGGVGQQQIKLCYDYLGQIMCQHPCNPQVSARQNILQSSVPVTLKKGISVVSANRPSITQSIIYTYNQQPHSNKSPNDATPQPIHINQYNSSTRKQINHLRIQLENLKNTQTQLKLNQHRQYYRSLQKEQRESLRNNLTHYVGFNRNIYQLEGRLLELRLRRIGIS